MPASGLGLVPPQTLQNARSRISTMALLVMPVLPQRARLWGIFGIRTLVGYAFLWSILAPLMLTDFAGLAGAWPGGKVAGGDIEKGP